MWETAFFDLRPGTPDQIKRALDKAAKKNWEFMAFDRPRNIKGVELVGVVVWVRRRKMAGHG